jgi:hypothetical protein
MNVSAFGNSFVKKATLDLNETKTSMNYSFLKLGDKTLVDLDLDGIREKM